MVGRAAALIVSGALLGRDPLPAGRVRPACRRLLRPLRPRGKEAVRATARSGQGALYPGGQAIGLQMGEVTMGDQQVAGIEQGYRLRVRFA